MLHSFSFAFFSAAYSARSVGKRRRSLEFQSYVCCRDVDRRSRHLSTGMTTTNACLKSKLCLTEHKVRSWSEARSRGQKPGHEVRSQVLRSETKSQGQKPGHKYRNKITNQVLRSETRSRTSSQNYKPGHNVRSRSQGRKPDHEIASLVMRSETMSR